MNEIEAYIRATAARYGINPDVAVRLASAEGGLHDPYRQAEAMLDYGREESYGPFQLHTRGGMGADAIKAGIDPRTDWKGGVDYALYRASQGGWSPWMAAPKIGLSNWEGITQGMVNQAPSGTTRKPYAAGGAAVVPEGTGERPRSVGGAGVVPSGTPGRADIEAPDIDHPPNPTVGRPDSPIAGMSPKKHWLENLGTGIGNIKISQPSVGALPAVPGPAITDAPAPQPAVAARDPNRMALAQMILQRLNTGRLF